PAANFFEGLLTIAFRLPVLGPNQDPTTITLMMLALDDSQTRITQSLEEQTGASPESVAVRAPTIGADTVRLLPGGSVPTSLPTELVCSVRTAGPAGAPTATLINVPQFVSLTPSPGSAAGRNLALNATIAATFSSNVSGVGPTNFRVQGSISGQQF